MYCTIISNDKQLKNRFSRLLSFITDVEIKDLSAYTTDTGTVPELVFIDMDSAKLIELKYINDLQTKFQNPSIVFISSNEQNAMKAIKLGGFDFLLKPIAIDELKTTIDRYSQRFVEN